MKNKSKLCSTGHGTGVIMPATVEQMLALRPRLRVLPAPERGTNRTPKGTITTPRLKNKAKGIRRARGRWAKERS